jgi:SWI/SNF-related matrix-associated actin-dependent regulator 1 of chromatin subfamily A
MLELGSRERSDRAAFDAMTEPLGWKLRDYQHEGREFIVSRRGTLLADTMRLGKTITSVASHDPASGPMLVAAPLSVREVWLNWFKRRWPDKRPVVLTGRTVRYIDPAKPRKPRKDPGYTVLEGERLDAAVLASAELVFCNYDVLAGWQNFGNRRIGTLVLDEVHLCAKKSTRRSRAALFLSPTAERVIAATGTPLWNKPVGLWPILACVCPGAFGKYHEFASRYSNGHMGAYGFEAEGVSNEGEFRQRMQEVMIRRTWQDVVAELPPIERSVEVVSITEEQAYQIEVDAERVRDHSRRANLIGALARFRRVLAKLKVGGAIDAALRVLEGDERVVVWTWHRDVAYQIEDALAKAGYPGLVVTGATDADKRDAILDRWRHGKPSPLVITMSVGQVGIDLSAARQAVFAELDFTPSVVAQAEMRVFSASHPTAVTYVIIDHDVDRRILDALQTKCDAASRLGVPAAETAIDVLTHAFEMGGAAGDDLQALAVAVLADHPDDIDEKDDYHGALWDMDWEEA